MLPIVVALSTAVAFATPSPSPSPSSSSSSPSPSPSSPVYALTESGGLSRGAYDAGVTWAVLRVLAATHRAHKPDVLAGMEPARLAVVSGASSGTLNSFLAALSWCDDVERRAPPEEDVLYQTWMQVSWAALFPPASKLALDDGVRWRPDDGILTRAAYNSLVQQLERDTDRNDRVRAPFATCSILLASTLTPLEPLETKLDEHLRVKSQRLVSVIEAHLDDGRLTLTNALPSDADAGPWWRVGDRDAVSFADISALVEAGTAFPVSFGPKLLKGAVVDGSTRPVTATRAFVDGGLFDNTPLDLADLLARPPNPPTDPNASSSTPSPSLSSLTLVAIDPERRRGPGDASLFRTSERARGFGAAFDLFGQFVDVARGYEMQDLARRIDHDTHLVIADRSSAIVGETMMWFGAFLYEGFRRFDFYAGIYDGLVAMARDQCAKKTGAADEKCVEDTVDAFLDDVVTLSDDAAFVVRTLQCAESARCAKAPEPKSRMLPLMVAASTEIFDEEQHDLGDEVDTDGDGIPDARDCPAVERMVDGKCALARFIGKMKARGAEDVLADESSASSSSSMPTWRVRERDVVKQMFGDWDAFVRAQSFAVLDRARDLEHEDEQAHVRGAADRRRALVVANEALRTWDTLSGDRGLFYLPSTVPAELWPMHIIVPTRVGVAPVRGDVDVGWDLVGVHPGIRFVPDVIADGGLRVGPTQTRSYAGLALRQPVAFGTFALPIDVELRYSASLGFVRTASPAFSFADVELGALFVDKVRIAALVENVPAAFEARRVPAVVVTIGLNDISGLAYWASQLP